MRIAYNSSMALIVGAIIILSTAVPTAGFQQPGPLTPGSGLAIADHSGDGTVATGAPESKPSDQHMLYLPLVMNGSVSGTPVPVQVHAAFDDGSGQAGAPVGAGVIVRVDGSEKGITDANSMATISLLPGSHTVEAVLPSLAIGQQAITVTAGQSSSVTVLLNGNADVIEPSQLVLDELVNGALPLNTPTITLRFLKNGATVPVTHLEDIELGSRSPSFSLTSLTDLFHVTSSGAVVATDASNVNSLLLTMESDAVIEVIASDARGLSYDEEIAFAPALYTLNGQLAAPPSQPALPLGGIVLQASFGNGITKTVTSNSTGAFTLTQVPGGMVDLTGSTTAGGNVYHASAYVAVDGDQNLLVRMLGLTDILAKVVPWEISPAPGGAVTRLAPKQMPAQTRRGRANAATPSHSAVPRVDEPDVIVQASAQDAPVSDSANYLVPKGTHTAILEYLVASSEYPWLDPFRTGCDDTWSLWVLTSSGGLVFATDRTVKSQLYSPPTWQLTGSTGYIQQEIDVSQLTANADIVLTVYVTATNIGDDQLPTTVQATLKIQKTITIDKIERDTVNPTKGQSDRYSIPRPGDRNHYQRHFDVTFTKPDDVTITNVTVELRANGLVLQKVVDGAPGTPGITVLSPKKLRIDVTFGNIASAVASTPPPADQILYRFTLTGHDGGGAQIQSEPKESPQFYALWQMPDGFLRYGVRDIGGDEWASQSTYNWLDQNFTLVTRIDDISGEHARNIGHKTHYEGKDIDMFHVYTFPGTKCGMSGAQNYLCLRQDVQAALNGDATARTNVTAWATQTRARFDLLLADANVHHIYYAIGSAANANPAQSTTSLAEGWARNLLRNGSYTNPDGVTLNLGIGTWTNANNTRISYNEIHNSHFHVALN